MILQEGLVNRMEFRDLKKQYLRVKTQVDKNIQMAIDSSSFIGGEMIDSLERSLASYVNSSHCITCANGTDALQIALMVWGIGEGDAVFVPDFTFFSSGEVVAAVGATPVFVDVRRDTYNIDVHSLDEQIQAVIKSQKLIPKAIIAVDLFGQPAEYGELRRIASEYNLYLLEDGAQGFGGSISSKMVGSFGDISTTSFFPAKPLGCYGDGGAIFTDNDEWNEVIRSIKVHGKGSNKYDNVRIGMNSRLDTIQAGVLEAKFPVFVDEELDKVQEIAAKYIEAFGDVVATPIVLPGYRSSWAQYTIQLHDKQIRDGLQKYLKDHDVPSMVYYQKPMHKQKAFLNSSFKYDDDMYSTTNTLCDTVLSLPFSPYINDEDMDLVSTTVKQYILENT